MSDDRLPISILLLVKNEEEHLPEVLKSVEGFGEVVVVDSMSTDRTVEIAEQHGCRVVQRVFDDWATHQNWVVENVDFKHEWIFSLDADERMTPAVKKEVAAIASQDPPPHRAYYCERDNFLFGQCLRHALSGAVVMRFYQPKEVRFARRVNQQPVLKEPAGYLKNRFIHYHFSRGFSQWFSKHNLYSTWEAMEWIEAEQKTPISFKALFSRDWNTRVQALKRLSFALPFRPALKFFYLYLWRLGFLDGRPGFHCCMLMGIFEYMIGLKVREMKRRERGEPI
ncbi:MAG: glycosyltransferase family 2 protein [Planctomycetota bacterium]